jgi:acetyl/propionyl-CoA carboxylase alpha subunit
MADEAVCIGEAPSSESYLNVPNLLAAAVSRGAQAVHPVSHLLGCVRVLAVGARVEVVM